MTPQENLNSGIDPDLLKAGFAPPSIRKVVRGVDKLKGASDDLINHWNNLQGEFDKAGVSPVIKSGYRSVAQQQALYNNPATRARTKGNDGINKISPHQRGDALDISFSAAQKAKGHQIIADYASRNGLHVPSDEPWHIAIPRQQKQKVPEIDPGVLNAGFEDGGQSDIDPDVLAAGFQDEPAMSIPTPRNAERQVRQRPMSLASQVTAGVQGQAPDTGMGALRRIDQPEVQRRSRIQRQMTAENQRANAVTMPGLPAFDSGPMDDVEREAAIQYRAKGERDAEAETARQQAEYRKQKPEIDRLAQVYREGIRGGNLTGQKWFTEAAAKGVAPLVEKLAGIGSIAARGGSPGAQVGVDTLRLHAQALQQAAMEEGATRNEASKFVQDIAGGLIGSSPEMALISVGVPAPVAFAGGEGLGAAGRGEAVAPAALHGGLQGLAWELGGEGGSAAQVARKAGTVGLATGGVELASGKSLREAAKTGATNAAMVGIPALAGATVRPMRLREAVENDAQVRSGDVGGDIPPTVRDSTGSPMGEGGVDGGIQEPSVVRHVDLQARVQRGPNAGDFKKETKAQREARQAQVAQQESIPTSGLEPATPAELPTETLQAGGVDTTAPSMPDFVKAAQERKAKRSAEKAQGIEYRRAGADPYELIDDIIIRGHEIYSEKIKPTFQEWSKKIRDEFGPESDSHLKTVWSQLSGEKESSVSSLKKASLAADRERHALADFSPAEHIAWEKSLESAKSKGLDGDHADRVADRILDGKQSVVDVDESAGLLLRIRELENRHEALTEQIWNEKDPAKLSELRDEAQGYKEQFDKLSEASKQSKSAVARSLAFNRGAIDENYSLVGMQRGFKADTGKEATGKTLAEIESLHKKISDLTGQLETANEKAAKAEAESATRKLRREATQSERQVRKGTREERTKALDTEAAQLKDLIAAAWKKTQGQSSIQPSVFARLDPEGEITKLVLKLARNRVQRGIVTAEGLVDEIHGFLSDTIDGLDKRDVRELISGYGRTPGKRSELQKQLDALKSELYQGLSAEDIAAGTRSPRSEGPRQREQYGPREGPQPSDANKLPAEGPRLSDARQVPLQGPKKSEARSSGVPLQGPKLSDVNKVKAEGPRMSEASRSGQPLEGPKLSDIRKVPEQGPSLSEGVGRKAGPRIQDAPFVGPRTSDARKLPAEGPKITDAPKLGPRDTWPTRKKQLEKQIAEIEKKIEAQDFSDKAKRGKTVLTPEAQAIADRLEAVKNQYQNLKRRNEPWNWLRNLSSIRKAGMLSGYMTHIRNIVGTGGYLGFEEARRLPTVMLDAALAPVTGQRTATLSPSAMLDGVTQAIKVGLPEAGQILRRGATHEQMAQHQFQEINTGIKAIDTAFNIVFRAMSASDRVFYQASYKRNLVERAQAQAKTEARNDSSIKWRERAKEITDNPTKELEADAKHDALRSTFNNNNRLSDMVTRARSGAGAGGNFALDMVLPFDRTPTNVIARVIEASPLGFGKNAGQIAKALWTRKFSPAEQRAFTETFGRATTGTAVIALGWALASKGLLSTDDYGTTTLKVRDKKINLSAIAPVGTMLGVGAAMQKQHSKPDASKRGYIGAAIKPLADQPVLRATSQVSDIIKDPDRNFGRFAAGTAFSAVPMSGAVRTLGEAIDPAEKRYPDNTFKEQFQRNVPKWRESLPASQVRLLGSEVNKATKEATRLGLNIKGAVKQDTESPEDFKVREERENRYIKKMLEAVVALPEYDNETDQNKVEWLKKAKEQAVKDSNDLKPEEPEKPESTDWPIPEVDYDEKPKPVSFKKALMTKRPNTFKQRLMQGASA